MIDFSLFLDIDNNQLREHIERVGVFFNSAVLLGRSSIIMKCTLTLLGEIIRMERGA